MAREYFCAYHSYLGAMEQLTDEERGRLFTALLAYSQTGEPQQLSGNERFVFPAMRDQIDRDSRKYASKCETQAQNARKRWDATACNGIPRHAKYANEKEKEKTKAKEKEKEKENIKGGSRGNPGGQAAQSTRFRSSFCGRGQGLLSGARKRHRSPVLCGLLRRSRLDDRQKQNERLAGRCSHLGEERQRKNRSKGG